MEKGILTWMESMRRRADDHKEKDITLFRITYFEYYYLLFTNSISLLIAFVVQLC